MSSYLNFYLKPRKDAKPSEYVEIGSFSRSSVYYEYGNEYTAYGVGTPLTIDIVVDIINDLENENRKYAATIKSYEERKKLVATFNNRMEKKIAEIDNIDTWINDANENHEFINDALGWYRSLFIMMDNYTWNDKERANDLIWFGTEWYPVDDEEE